VGWGMRMEEMEVWELGVRELLRWLRGKTDAEVYVLESGDEEVMV
jgi:hypothetical protein